MLYNLLNDVRKGVLYLLYAVLLLPLLIVSFIPLVLAITLMTDWTDENDRDIALTFIGKWLFPWRWNEPQRN